MSSSLLPRPRTFATLVVAAAVALPAAGCGTDSSGGGGNAAADPASFLPASAPVYVEAQVRPGGDLKANVETVAGKILRTSDPGGKIVGLIDRGLKDDGASYAKDIEPWLGQRAGLAVTGVGAGGSDADVVAAIASKDGDAAEKFVASRKGASEREYRGVTYRFKADDDLAVAVVDHAVVIGTVRGFKSAIDARSGQALSEREDFKKARDTVGTDGLGFFYADPGRLFDLAAGAASGSASQSQLSAAKGLLTGSGLRSIAAKLDVAQDAVRVDAAFIGLKKGLSGAAGSGDGPGAAAAVPAGSWLSIGVGDVGATVTSMLSGLSQSGATGGLDPQALLSGLTSQLGFDVEKDLLAWMGDASLFVRGTTLSDLGGALVVRSKDPAATKRAIGQLRTLLRRFGADVGALRGAGAGGAEGFSVSAGPLPEGIQVAAKDDTFVVAYGKDALADALGRGDTLGDSAPYKTAAGLLDGAKPSFFLDTPQVVTLIGAVAGSDEGFQKAKPTLDAFGPAAAGSTSEGDVTRLKVAVSVP
ncbi:MAG TPA: DUF3352 domain-containing protein [Baekduia sp.]|nr:DUF3352 domain-containing protein [Baekduia sp.]